MSEDRGSGRLVKLVLDNLSGGSSVAFTSGNERFEITGWTLIWSNPTSTPALAVLDIASVPIHSFYNASGAFGEYFQDPYNVFPPTRIPLEPGEVLTVGTFADPGANLFVCILAEATPPYRLAFPHA